MDKWLWIALIGLAAGALTFFAIPGKVRGGIVVTMLVGAVAAVALTWIGNQVGLAVPGQTSGFFIAVIGSGLVLAVWRMAMGRT